MLNKEVFPDSNDRFNVHGGAISIGHPLGATGQMSDDSSQCYEQRGHKSGIVTICLGGGNAVAMLVYSN